MSTPYWTFRGRGRFNRQTLDNRVMARENLLEFFADFARLRQRFITFDDGYRTFSYSYREVAGAAAGFAQRLRAAGIVAGERVVIWGENRPEWVAAFWGCLLAGAVVVPVDFRSSRELVERIQGIVKARVLLAGEEVAAGAGDWRLAALDWSPMPVPEAPAGRGGLCEIVFTSGATAEPKGVTITHANILANLVPVESEIRKYRPLSFPFAPIRFLNLLPLSHLFGQSMATFIPPVLPGEVVFMRGFNSREIVRQIQARRISVLVAVPRILELLREYVVASVPGTGEPAPAGATWLRRWWHYRRVHQLFGWKFWAFVVGAAPLDPALEEFWSKLGFVVIQGYGLTETAPIVTLNHPFHTSKGSVGKPIGGVEIRIAEDGEILVRGANVSEGYFQAGASASPDGWFATGDLGSIDGNGQVFVRGRKKEVIVTPEGLNVIPEDVERVLAQVPGVRDAAVVGAGAAERVHAVVVVEAGTELEVVMRAANARLEAHQQIQEISAWPGGQLPRTEGTEKLRRVAIREWVNGSGVPASRGAVDGGPLAGLADETPLAEMGLSSLDRVELLMQLEAASPGLVEEGALGAARTVGELRAITRRPEAANPQPAVAFPRWTRSPLARLFRRLALPPVLVLLRVFAWIRVTGREHPEGQAGPVLYASNHQSIFDVPVLYAALRGRRYGLAVAMGMDWFDAHFHPERHALHRRLGNSLQYYLAVLFFNAFPLAQHEAGARESLRYIGELVSEGWSILLFPEGRRMEAEEVGSFRPGVGMIGTRLRLQVVPVRLTGLNTVLGEAARFPSPGRVGVAFGPAVVLDGDDYGELAREVERAVRRLGGD